MPQFDDTYSSEKMAELRRKEEDSLIQSLAVQYGYEYVDLRGISVNPNALRVVPEETARAANLVCFELTRKKLSVAIRNPNNPATKELIKKLEADAYTVNIFMTSSSSLEHGWARYHDQKTTEAVKHGVLDIDADRIAEQAKKFKTPEAVSAHILDIRTVNSARRISETLESIFAGALALGASDVHIEPEEHVIRLRFRLDGVLRDIIDLEHTMYDRLMSRLKLLSGMILNIKDEAQDGRFTFEVGDKKIEVRSSVIPGSLGESIVMRLLDPTVASFNIETLGLNKRLYEVMMEQLKRPNGLIVTTGPTGSGKTTALYAFLRHTHNEGVKIITIENPVEYKIEGLVQTQVGEDYTFSSGLRAILRQDPDIIMVGEIRDREVAETAIHAAQTGHLVFSTLHTNSAVGAFPRLMDLGVDSRMIGASVNIVIGQRLVRILCENCKKAREATAEEAAIIKRLANSHPEKLTVPEPLIIYDASTCVSCNHTGFKGREGVFEAIIIDEAVEETVINDPREHIILEAAAPQNIPTMGEDGISKVLKGETSLKELQRVVDINEGQSSEISLPPLEDEVDITKHIV